MSTTALSSTRVRTVGLSALVCLGLAACSTASPPASGSLTSSGAPLPVQGYDWHLNHDEAEISLAYGMAETDDVPLDLSCTTGSPDLNILLTADKGTPASIRLESGGDMQTYPARVEAAALGDGIDLTATASLTDPVFKRFRQLGWLAVHMGQERRALAATPEAVAQVQSFFELCERSS